MASNAVLAPSHPVVVTIVQVNGVRTIRTSPLICRGDDVYRSGGRLAVVRVPGGNIGRMGVGPSYVDDTSTVFVE